MGMSLYLCEHYDLSKCRIIGVTSGAVCAALIRCLEHAGPSASAIARKGAELLEIFEGLATPVLSHPTSWFSRVGQVAEEFTRVMIAPLPDIAAEDHAARTRIVIGMRQLVLSPIPHLRAAGATDWASNVDFLDAVAASSNVWPVTSPSPLRRFRGASCCDGVNAFSLWDNAAYIMQRLRGRTRVTAPSRLFNGGPLNWIGAIWNCVVMDALLPTHPSSVSPGSARPGGGGGEQLYWVSPGEGGHLELLKVLYLNLPWGRHLWRQGYNHAQQLDESGYFEGLAPRRRSRTSTTPHATPPVSSSAASVQRRSSRSPRRARGGVGQ